ncbi:MAG: hypothetical protein WBL67_02310, partial [Nitrososphaeraceae archaeon]
MHILLGRKPRPEIFESSGQVLDKGPGVVPPGHTPFRGINEPSLHVPALCWGGTKGFTHESDSGVLLVSTVPGSHSLVSAHESDSGVLLVSTVPGSHSLVSAHE